MVAKITMPHSAQKVLYYNENKVSTDKAVCIGGENFLDDAASMIWQRKLDTFRLRNELNDRAGTRMIHISLNFDLSESLTPETLTRIAAVYMQKIGFGEQPYLVYQHHDAGHPHIHIVSTTIRSDGSRIPTHNLGRNQSEKARKEIEKSFRLVQADTRKRRSSPSRIAARDASGTGREEEAKQRIASVLQMVLTHFRCTSLSGLNAVLKSHNIKAERGKENSRIHNRRGLRYRILNEDGSRSRIAVKADALPGEPAMTTLERYFKANKVWQSRLKQLLQQRLDAVLLRNPVDIDAFKKLLSRENVFLLLRTNADGRHCGITYIDMLNRWVCNGSDLGTKYSLTVLRKMSPMIATGSEHAGIKESDPSRPSTELRESKNRLATDKLSQTSVAEPLREVMPPVPSRETAPASLLQKKKEHAKRRAHS